MDNAIRPAASVILLKPSAEGFDTLLLKRSDHNLCTGHLKRFRLGLWLGLRIHFSILMGLQGLRRAAGLGLKKRASDERPCYKHLRLTCGASAQVPNNEYDCWTHEAFPPKS